MTFKEWWKGLLYWKKGLLFGFIFGILVMPTYMLFIDVWPDSIRGLFFLYTQDWFCNFIGNSASEECGFNLFFYSSIYNPVFYSCLGLLISLAYERWADVRGCIIEWWKRLDDFIRKGLFVGIAIGLIKAPLLIVFGEKIPESIGRLIVLPDEMICKVISILEPEQCGFLLIIYGMIYNPIIYGLLGGLIGSLYRYFNATLQNTKKQ